MRYFFNKLIILLLVLISNSAYGALSENKIIVSEVLGYKLQYRTWLADEGVTPTNLVFVTDGQAYLKDGSLLKELTKFDKNLTTTTLFVFVDSRDPEQLKVNRRNTEFMCNLNYANFYKTELLPLLRQTYQAEFTRANTAILGVSFGGLNAACFGLLLNDTVGKLAMHSPANDRHLKILSKMYLDRAHQPLTMYVSVGTVNDNYIAVRKFVKTVKGLDHHVTFTVNRKARHDWDNWQQVMKETLSFLLN